MKEQWKQADYLLWLCMVEQMWQGKMKKLLDFFREPENIYHAERNVLDKLTFLKSADVECIINSRESFSPGKERKMLEEKGIGIVTVYDEDYPPKLREIEDYPYVLFFRGNRKLLSLFSGKVAAVIGARVCTQYGIYTAQEFSMQLAGNQVVVISGMARGIDSAVHRAAIAAGGVTAAVLGCGVDICYPPENLPLYEEIANHGILLSEYPPGTPPVSWQFPKRNRIISALSDLILITEAKERSGTLITARWALEQGKDVCVVPGRINDPLSQGCNKLLREGASPVLEASDLFLILGICEKKIKKQKKFLEKENEVLYSVLGFCPKSVDEILEETHMDEQKILGILMKLQLEGLVEEVGKNLYVRKIV